MTWLAPWMLAIGALLGVGAIVAHLIARDVPPPWLLPTARFIPAARSDVLTRALRPRDPWLLLVRLGILAALAVAAADPALRWHSRTRATVMIADLSRSSADRGGVVRAVRERIAPGDVIVQLDTIARVVDAAALDSAALSSVAGPGRLSAALLVAFEAARRLARSADSVSIVLVSPLAVEQFDAATDSIRALWDGPITVVRVPALPARTATAAPSVRGSADDPLRLTLASIASDSSVRVVRDVMTADDSAHARSGGTIVLWPVRGAVRDTAYAISVGDATLVAPLERRTIGSARAVAWWADGTAAAIEQPLGAGCVRAIGMSTPSAGDLLLTARARTIISALMARCGAPFALTPATDSAVARLTGAPMSAPVARPADVVDTTIVRIALALALLLLLLEWRMRQPVHT